MKNEEKVGEVDSVASQYVAYLETLSRRWSSSVAASLVTPALLQYLQPRFHRCGTPIKVRVILSLLYLSESVREEGRQTLLLLLGEAEVDKDEWVKKLARLASSYVLVGAIDVRETDSETTYQIIKFLNQQKTKHRLDYQFKPPLEAPHLANVLTEKVVNLRKVPSAAPPAPFANPSSNQKLTPHLTSNLTSTSNVQNSNATSGSGLGSGLGSGSGSGSGSDTVKTPTGYLTAKEVIAHTECDNTTGLFRPAVNFVQMTENILANADKYLSKHIREDARGHDSHPS